MYLTYLNSATVLIETKSTKILCDPWLTGSTYYGSWYSYPKLETEIDITDFFDVNYIYISHIHPDHLHIETLSKFPKNIPILIHDYKLKFVYNTLKSIGFINIIEVGHKKEIELSYDLKMEILAADDCNPEKCSLFIGCKVLTKTKKSLSIDSLSIFKSSNSVLVNINDCPYDMAIDVVKYIKEKYKTIDMLLLGYAGAGPYPQCFNDLTNKEKIIEAKLKKEKFYQQAINYIIALKPKSYMPFAGKYTLGGRLINLNKWRGQPEMKEVEKDLPQLIKNKNIKSNLLITKRYYKVDIRENNSKLNYLHDDLNKKKQYIINVLSKKNFSYDNEKSLEKNKLLSLLKLAQQKKLNMQKIYNFYSNLIVYLDVGKDFYIKIPYKKEEVLFVDSINRNNPFVKITLSKKALISALTRKAQWSNLEVGSHLSFFRSKKIYVRGIYTFLNFFSS